MYAMFLDESQRKASEKESDDGKTRSFMGVGGYCVMIEDIIDIERK